MWETCSEKVFAFGICGHRTFRAFIIITTSAYGFEIISKPPLNPSLIKLLTMLFIHAFGGATILSIAAAQRLPGSPTVKIDSGALVGVAISLPSITVNVQKYLGIPFAASPPQRFGPPVKPEKWTVPLDATKYKPACIQQFNGVFF
jgi:hypothetical protein